jgi:hypothetical protein
MFPTKENILALIDLLLTLPSSSAICEQGFSEMKYVKSDWRSSLGNQSLNDLMRILLHSKSVRDFDPTTAIHLWRGSGARSRRPNIRPYGPRKDKLKDIPDVEEDSDLSEDSCDSDQ